MLSVSNSDIKLSTGRTCSLLSVPWMQHDCSLIALSVRLAGVSQDLLSRQHQTLAVSGVTVSTVTLLRCITVYNVDIFGEWTERRWEVPPPGATLFADVQNTEVLANVTIANTARLLEQPRPFTRVNLTPFTRWETRWPYLTEADDKWQHGLQVQLWLGCWQVAACHQYSPVFR